MPGVCWDQAAWQAKHWHSSPVLSLSLPLSRREHLPVTFVCQSSSPPSVPAFLRVTLFSALWNQFTSPFLCPSSLQLKPEALPCPPLSHHTHSAAFKPQGLPCKQGPASSSPPDQSWPAGCGSPSCPGAVPPSSSLLCPRLILLATFFSLWLFGTLVFSLFSLHTDLESDLSVNPSCATYYLGDLG